MHVLRAIVVLGQIALMQQLIVAGEASEPSRFSVEVVGDGPDVICIPGLTSSSRVFAPLVDGLKDQYRFHLLQVHGFAGLPAKGNSEGNILDGLAEEIATYIVSNKIARPTLIGHSFGGEASLLLASKHPDLAGKLIVVDALPYFPLVFDPTATAPKFSAQAAAFRDSMSGMDDATFKSIQSETVKRLVKAANARAEVLDDSLASDRGVAARSVFELMTTDLRSALSQIAVPINVIYAHDPSMGRSAEAIRQLYEDSYSNAPKAEFKQIDESYHFVMLDQPDRFVEVVRECLEAK